MKKLLYAGIILLLVASSANAASLLTGQTPSNYTLPSGWSLVKAQNFESGCGTGEWCGRWDGSISTTNPHSGSYGVHGTYYNNQADVGWSIYEGNVGSFTEIYLSWYEYISSEARFNDEFFLSNFSKGDVYNGGQEVVLDWFWSTQFNDTQALLAIVPQGTYYGSQYGEYQTVPVGQWVQWEIHYRPDTGGSSNGFYRVYKNGALLVEKNGTLNGGVDMTDTMVQIGGVYTKNVWMTDYPTCETCSGALGSGTDECTNYMFSGRAFDDQPCPPNVPAFSRSFDDIIVMKTGGSSGDPGPYTSNVIPAKGSTGVQITPPVITFYINDDVDVLTPNGVVSIGPPGSEVNYTCSSGLSCTGGGTNLVTVSYTNGTNWSYSQTINISVAGFQDTYGNVINESWSFQTDTTPPTGLAVTTTTLPNATVGQAYTPPALAASGGTSPYTWADTNTLSSWPDSPYPPSTHIKNITWDWDSVEIKGPGSDLWHIAWTTDDKVWTAWGDGGGPEVPDDSGVICRAHMGVASTMESPPGITWTNVWGCKADGTGCQDWGELTHDAACDAPYGDTTNDYGVPQTIFAIGNDLYVVQSIQGVTEARILKSTDGAHSWTIASWTWDTTTGGFHPSGFVTYGAGNSGARDSYAYLLGGKVGDITGIYMARVPVASLMTQASYEYFTGTAASPSWGTWANATRVLYDPDRVGPDDGPGNYNYMPSKMQYFSAIGRYLLTTHGGDMPELRVYDAPEPWGPWTTVYYSDSWGSYAQTHALYYNIIPKFISGNDFWMIYSAGGGPVDYDKLYLMKGTLVLASGASALPTGLAIPPSGSGNWGTPTVAGTYNFAVRVTDSLLATDDQSLSLVVGAAVPSGQVTTTISAIEDTHISDGYGENFSTDVRLRVRQVPDGVMESQILGKVVLGLPDNVSVQSATMYMYMETYNGIPGTDPMRLYAYRVSGTVPTISTVTDATFAGTLENYESYADVTTTPGWVQWDVTNMVTWAFVNSSSLYFAIDGSTGSAAWTNRRFTSMEGTEIYRPYLSVTYMQLTGPPGSPSISAPGKMRVSKMRGTFK